MKSNKKNSIRERKYIRWQKLVDKFKGSEFKTRYERKQLSRLKQFTRQILVHIAGCKSKCYWTDPYIVKVTISDAKFLGVKIPRSMKKMMKIL